MASCPRESGSATTGWPYYSPVPHPSRAVAVGPSTSTYIHASPTGSRVASTTRQPCRRRHPGGFVLGLHSFISRRPTPGSVKVVEWSEDGSYFVVLDIAAFMEQQDVCDSSEWATFHRQLLAYGFKKINHAPRGHDANTDRPAFRHPSFHRDGTQEHLKRPKDKWKEEGDPDHIRTDGGSPSGVQSPSPAELGLVVLQLQQEAHTMAAKYNAVLAKIEALEEAQRGTAGKVQTIWEYLKALGHRQTPGNTTGQPYPNAQQSWPLPPGWASTPFIPPAQHSNPPGHHFMTSIPNPPSEYGLPANVPSGTSRVSMNGGPGSTF